MYLLYEGGILMARLMTRGRPTANTEKLSDS
jgi:Sec-independent protein secretion pathway component TatC